MHTPGPWIWMDECELVPNANNDGSKGVAWLGRERYEGACDDEFVLLGAYDTDNFPPGHPYREKFGHRQGSGMIVICNPCDLPLIASAPDLLDSLKNLMGLFDTPAQRRLSGKDTFYREAIELARAALAKAEPGHG